MKSIIIIVAFAIVGLIISAPDANLVTAITPPTGYVGNVALTFTVASSGWTVNDKIILATGTPGSNDPSHTVATDQPSSPISATLNFPAAGTYNVWVKSTDDSETAQVEGQNSISIEITDAPAPAADLVSAISPTTGTFGDVELQISVKTSNWASGDKIILSTANPPNPNDLSLTVDPAQPTSPISATLNFPAAGTYNVWVKRTNSQIAQMLNTNPISIVISPAPVPPVDKPAADLISEITATDPKAGVEAEFTFKLKTSTSLKQNDIIYLSTEATTPTSTDKSVPVVSAPAAATFSGKFTLAKAGAYSAFVTRGSEITKQTAPAITVASSGYITMTLAIVLGLFLF